MRTVAIRWLISLSVFWVGLRGMAAEPPDFQTWWKSPTNSSYFPIAVWLQDPKNAERYKEAGVNLFVGLWRGPGSNQLATLSRAGVQVICSQNEFALSQLQNPVIAAWMHGDEPDNAQSLGPGKGYGPPILPEVVIRDYERMRAADRSRPVFLNLGQGVAWDNYIGRGVRRNHPEDYPEYIKGADLVSFDIYPVVHEAPEIRGKLEFVARGVQRLREWSRGEKMVWNCIECTHISNPKAKATPEQVRAEVWMSLIHGSRGIIYFVHQFKPDFQEAALLADPGMLAAVTHINHQIRELAPILNSATLSNVCEVSADVPIAQAVKYYNGHLYLFTVAMQNTRSRAVFQLRDSKAKRFEVLGESRVVEVADGRFVDDFNGYGVHLYRQVP